MIEMACNITGPAFQQECHQRHKITLLRWEDSPMVDYHLPQMETVLQSHQDNKDLHLFQHLKLWWRPLVRRPYRPLPRGTSAISAKKGSLDQVPCKRICTVILGRNPLNVQLKDAVVISRLLVIFVVIKRFTRVIVRKFSSITAGNKTKNYSNVNF